jgi:hypothetical protein
MMGTKNNPGDYDCYQHARPDEPMFVLLGRDPFAGLLVRLWAEARAELGTTSEEKLAEAYRCADAMGSWAIDERKSVAVAKAALHKIMVKRATVGDEARGVASDRAVEGMAPAKWPPTSCEHPIAHRRVHPATADRTEKKEACGVCLSYRWRDPFVDGGEWSGWRKSKPRPEIKLKDSEVNDTLGEALPREMARVRDHVIPAYIEIGQSGAFAVAMMRCDLDEAARALAEGDVAAMIRVYQSLKETNS